MILTILSKKVLHMAPRWEDTEKAILEIARGEEIILLKTNMDLINYETYIHKEISLVFGDGNDIFTLKDGGIIDDKVWDYLRDNFLLNEIEKTTMICAGHMYIVENV
jgi:hypothetical protein